MDGNDESKGIETKAPSKLGAAVMWALVALLVAFLLAVFWFWRGAP